MAYNQIDRTSVGWKREFKLVQSFIKPSNLKSVNLEGIGDWESAFGGWDQKSMFGGLVKEGEDWYFLDYMTGYGSGADLLFGDDDTATGYKLGRLGGAQNLVEAVEFLKQNPYAERGNAFANERALAEQDVGNRRIADINAEKRASEGYDLLSGMIQNYNAKMQSSFESVNQVLENVQQSAGTPSAITTLYLDRQAKTYLPTSIRDRGIAGTLGA